ncbi:MAG: serine/threonine protein kinase [Planctomycetota bacterium]|jgi:serine/threonine-protein kinase
MGKSKLNVGGYNIIKRIGNGARTTIYEATDPHTNEKIALKRAIYRKPQDTRIFEQIDTEYKVASQIKHPYVRKCFKLKKIRSMLRVREVLLTMELFDGDSLEDWPSLSLVDVLVVFRMVASGLNAMHQHGYVHSDIKPNNILMNKTGTIKIIDLGQSCKIGTVKPRIQGTPDYIAPEQVRRRPLGPKTDIFNLGATMYWALTGHSIPTLIPKKDEFGRTIPQERRAPHEVRRKIPIGLSNLVMECVEDNPQDRPDNMLTVVSRLDLLVHSILGDKLKTNKNGSANNRLAKQGHKSQ